MEQHLKFTQLFIGPVPASFQLHPFQLHLLFDMQWLTLVTESGSATCASAAGHCQGQICRHTSQGRPSALHSAAHFFSCCCIVLIATCEAQKYFFSICRGLKYRETFSPLCSTAMYEWCWVCPISPGSIQLKGTISTSVGTGASW